ncbi:MAG TPA: DeoR/GlpR family DNA-binding transcription regulator [Gemmataceae bacterium]|nr:DeoR/GlpR family DNA-binding transcription regulator [Gemmataceae bacterium]
MLVQERRQRVLDLVSRKGFMTLADLAKAVKVSESTLRRDLDHWNQQGLIKRIHGGAMFTGDGSALPALEERTTSQITEKRAIARVAASRIRNGDAVLLDGGTTTLEVAKLLVGRPLQIVTNSLPIANLFASSRETDLVMLGGYVYPRTGVALGPLAVRMMEDVHVHQTILSVAGITAKGLFNSNLLLVETERQMMRCSDQVVVVADHTKIGKQSLAFLCELSAVDALIVDEGITPEQRELIGQAPVRLVVAGATGNGVAVEGPDS